MHILTRLALFCLSISITIPALGQDAELDLSYPVTRKMDHVDRYHGVDITDPYRWLEDDRSEETAEWVSRQNELTEKVLTQIPFREEMRERLSELWNYPRQSTPYRSGDYYFVYRNNGTQNQSVLYRSASIEEDPKIFIDPNTFSDDGTVSLSGTALSHDSRYFAYGLSSGGSDWKQICVRDLKTGRTFSDTLSWVKFSGIAWHGDGFYYSGYDRPDEGGEYKQKNEYHKVFFHKTGTSQSSDQVIFEDKDQPLRNFGARTTDDERFLTVSVYESTSGNELWVKDLSGNSEFVKLVSGFESDYSVIDNEGARLFVQTNDQAPRGRVVEIDTGNPGKDRWKDLIPEDPDAVLQGVTVAGDQLVARYMKDATNFLVFYGRDGRKLHEYKPEVPATIGGVSGDRKDNILFFSVTSFVYPTVIYKYDLSDRRAEMIYRPDIDFDFDRYVTKQEWYTSGDGTRIPIFIVHEKGLQRTGDSPVLLYGYGGFNISIQPNFSPWRLAFLEKGGIYASANIRGGGEYGEEWHKAGTKLQKQNVFDDFIAAAEYMIDKKYTNSSRLAIHGRSNGGLLVGACMTQRPDLFRVALPGVGVLDMLRFHKFTIGWAWTVDYGSSDDPEEFKALRAYSPLHNIKKDVRYPATLVTTADHDDRVVPAHSFKFISTLQEKASPANPALIRIDVQAGHGAGKPVSKQIDEWTDVLSFMMYNLGMR